MKLFSFWQFVISQRCRSSSRLWNIALQFIIAIAGGGAGAPVTSKSAFDSILGGAGEDAWKQCWKQKHTAIICCLGAWDRSQCWDDDRNFELCCRSRSTTLTQTPMQQHIPKVAQVGHEDTVKRCAARLDDLHAATPPAALARLAAQVTHGVRVSLRNYSNRSTKYNNVMAPFLERPTPLEIDMVMMLVAAVAAHFEALDLTYWLHGQTLLNALRFYALAPWSKDAMLGVFCPSGEDLAISLAKLSNRVHSSFGPFTLTPFPCKSRWLLSFARSRELPYGTRSPIVSIEWFDPKGESAAWHRLLGGSSDWNHRHVLQHLFPVVRRRPFGNLLLPFPANPWSFARLSGFHDTSICEAPHGSSLNIIRVPCDAIAAASPIVLWSHAFASSEEFFDLLGSHRAVASAHIASAAASTQSPSERAAPPVDGATDDSTKATWFAAKRLAETVARAAESFSSGPGRPPLKVSLEIAADAIRGAHVALFGFEGGATCWKHLLGKQDILSGPKVSPRAVAM